MTGFDGVRGLIGHGAARRPAAETPPTALHRVSCTAFDALASGGGGARDIESLVRAQLSKRLLVLWNLLRLVRLRWPDSPEAACLQAAFDTIDAARRAGGDRVDGVLAYPTVGAWLLRCQRRLDGVPTAGPAEPDLGHAGAVAAAAALRARHPFDLPIRMRDGLVAFPGLGVARLGGGDGWGRARYAGSGAVLLEAPGCRLDLAVDERQESEHWVPVRPLEAGVGRYRLRLAVDDVDPYRDCGVLTVAPRVEESTLRSWGDMLDTGWSILVRHDAAQAGATTAGLSALVPLGGGTELTAASATCSDAVGAVALTPPTDPTDFALTLVHEFQHFKLDALLDLVQLHDGGADAVHFAPWRSDPRPINGLLHGAYAFLAIAGFWLTLARTLAGGSAAEAAFEFAWCREAVGRAVSGARASGQLTPLGERFVAGMAARLAQWRTATVAPVAARWARAMNDDAQVLWRLRNLHPDVAHVTEWADAWTGAAPRSRRSPPPTQLRPGPRVADRHPRYGLVRTYLRDPARFGADPLPDPGAFLDAAGLSDADLLSHADVLLVAGRFEDAARRYAGLVAADPGDVSAFAGLAVARQLSPTLGSVVYAGCPEVLYALFNRVREQTGHPPDVEALATWIAADLPRRDEHRFRVVTGREPIGR
jgi:HEXXH motif-containing protein